MLQHILSMQEPEDAEQLRTAEQPRPPFEELARSAPVLAGKLARLSPEQFLRIFPPENSVGPL
ncbi:hypothetical protein ASF74_15170 [Arthrobacter sp. Leaf145]|nr:hypothetical protein ASF74_15170 [Arthrobacter sp. Leaf145]